MHNCVWAGTYPLLAFRISLSPQEISLTSLAITTCLKSRARLEGLPFALASTAATTRPLLRRCRRGRWRCRRRRVCRPLAVAAAANRNSSNNNNTNNCAQLTLLFAHTSLCVCMYVGVCVWVFVCMYVRWGERRQWAVGWLAVYVSVRVRVYVCGVCFKNSLLHVYFQSSRNAPMLCAAAASSFWRSFLARCFLSHSGSLCLFCGMCVCRCECTYVHMLVGWLVDSACVLVFALYKLIIYLNNSLFNYRMGRCHSFHIFCLILFAAYVHLYTHYNIHTHTISIYVCT